MKLSEVVKTKTKGYVFIDTCQLNDEFGNMMDMMGMGNEDAVAGEYETMVFKCDKNGDVESWSELDKNNYPTEAEAKKGHKEMVSRWLHK